MNSLALTGVTVSATPGSSKPIKRFRNVRRRGCGVTRIRPRKLNRRRRSAVETESERSVGRIPDDRQRLDCTIRKIGAVQFEGSPTDRRNGLPEGLGNLDELVGLVQIEIDERIPSFGIGHGATFTRIQITVVVGIDEDRPTRQSWLILITLAVTIEVIVLDAVNLAAAYLRAKIANQFDALATRRSKVDAQIGSPLVIDVELRR